MKSVKKFIIVVGKNVKIRHFLLLTPYFIRLDSVTHLFLHKTVVD